MSLFITTPEQKVQAARHVVAMDAAGLPTDFVGRVLELAQEDQGVFELLELWVEAAESPSEREHIVANLSEIIDEHDELPAKTVHKPKINFENLPEIADQVAAHKQKLRQLIDRHGGVTEVARRAGMPQPSLSRMLNSASMPRRTTLYRIARALDVDESEVVAEWVR